MTSTPEETITKAVRAASKAPKRLARRVAIDPRTVAARKSVTSTARTVIPEPVRMTASRAFLRRPGVISVPVEQLLLGAQGGHAAADIAEATGDLLWGSRPVSEGPHAELLRAAKAGDLTDEQILESPYAELARACVTAFGSWFGSTDDAGILEQARAFIAGTSTTTRPHQSGANDPILVAPIKWSSAYMVLDGHHRVARAAVDGRTHVDVVVKRFPVTTPLMDHLLRMSWLDGTRELYQPLDFPDLQPGFTIVRRCTDRRDEMLTFLAKEGLTSGSYLDVASFYGWFVGQLTEAGFSGEGIERDPLAQDIGVSVYGIDPASLNTGDAVEFLTTSGRTWDVVSCFSLLHHFVLGRSVNTAEELIKALDGATGRILFFDTGQGTEEWFKDTLTEWTPEYIEAWLRLNTTFDEVLDLGPDTDAVGAYSTNYARHLFALVRR